MRNVLSKLRALSLAAKLGIAAASVVVIGAAANATQPPITPVTPPAPADIHQVAPTPKIEHKTVTETKVVPFTSSTVNDPSSASGVKTTKVQGVDGVETITYDVTYTDGAETNRSIVSDQVTTPAVNEVIAVGTYVAPAQPTCPNGTYVNSAGNTVCSPYPSPSVPSGATAQCVDGSYSFSQSHSGTCSHHGGVARWL